MGKEKFINREELLLKKTALLHRPNESRKIKTGKKKSPSVRTKIPTSVNNFPLWFCNKTCKKIRPEWTIDVSLGADRVDGMASGHPMATPKENLATPSATPPKITYKSQHKPYP